MHISCSGAIAERSEPGLSNLHISCLGPPRMAFETQKGSQDPRLETVALRRRSEKSGKRAGPK